MPFIVLVHSSVNDRIDEIHATIFSCNVFNLIDIYEHTYLIITTTAMRTITITIATTT